MTLDMRRLEMMHKEIADILLGHGASSNECLSVLARLMAGAIASAERQDRAGAIKETFDAVKTYMVMIDKARAKVSA